MKFFVSVLLMGLMAFTACLYLPWWSIAITCFIVTVFIRQRPGLAFLSGFVALFILWAGMSFWISNNNEQLLAHKVSVILFKTDSPLLLIAGTGLIGAITGAFSALTGSLFRKVITGK